MQKKVTIALAILMFLGFLFVLRSLIIGQINIVIGLPLLILPLIIVNIYARVLLKGKKMRLTRSTAISTTLNQPVYQRSAQPCSQKKKQ